MFLWTICENLASTQYLRKYEYIHIMSHVYMLLHKSQVWFHKQNDTVVSNYYLSYHICENKHYYLPKHTHI